MLQSIQIYPIIAAGGTDVVVSASIPQVSYLAINGGSVVLLGNYSISYSTLPPDGASWSVIVGRTLDLNGNTFTVYGIPYTSAMATSDTEWVFDFIIISGNVVCSIKPIDLSDIHVLDGSVLVDGTVSLAKLESLASAEIIVGNGSNVPTAVAMSGDAMLSNAGALTIANSAITNAKVSASAGIAVSKLAAQTASKMARFDASGFLTATGAFLVNADVDAAAAIAFSKMAALTASQVMVTSAGGVATTTSTLSATLGGNGLNNSAATGFPIWAAGTQTVGALTDSKRVDISFVTAAQGTYRMLFPFACMVTGAKARVTSTISGTDDGTVQLQNNSATNMTAGLITIPASSAHGTAVSVSPSANNVFSAGQEMLMVVSKTTSGGMIAIDFTITRTS